MGCCVLKHFVEILRRLRPVHDSRLSASPNDGCAEDTREDILQEVETWVRTIEAPSSVYWIRGKMGTGKTTIVRTIADRLQGQGLLGCVYFASRDGASMDSRRMIQTIAFELANTFEGLRPIICAGIMTLGDLHSAPPLSMVRMLLAEPLRHLLQDGRPVVLILDNLPRTSRLYSAGVNALVRSLISSLPQGTKLIISGVDDGSNKSLSDLLPPTICNTCTLHEQPIATVAQDVNNFYHQQFRAILGDQPSADDQNWLASTIGHLTNRTGHLFMFASIVARYVNADMHSPLERLKEVTASLQKSLDTTSAVFEPLDIIYKLILDDATVDDLDKYHPEVHARLKSLLGCIMVSNGELSVKELAQALHLDEKLVTRYTDALSSILIVARDGGHAYVRPFHPSLVDFLFDVRRCTVEWAISPHATHLLLAGFCFDMMEKCFTKAERTAASMPNATRATCLQQSLLSSYGLHYACTNWTVHVASTEGLSADVLTRTSRFCADLILPWLEAVCVIDSVDDALRGLQSLRQWISVSVCLYHSNTLAEIGRP
jgi:ABC-type dipeptide/oligopeptide/nickel transport system ATPase subunit